MSDTPRYYKWYPTVSCDLGTMPFAGDWTINDRIQQLQSNGAVVNIWYYNPNTNGFGRTVTERVNGRTRQVWKPGVTVEPVEISGVSFPVWFEYHGDGVCVAKLPEGEVVEEHA